MAQTEIIQHQPRDIAPPASGHVLTPLEMLGNAIERGADPVLLERLMMLSERWEATQARKAFDAAMADAKALIGTVKKDAKGNYGQYADFANVTRTVDPALAAHGFRYRHRLDQQTEKSMTVTCIVYHRDGHSEETTLTAPLDTSGSKNAIQQIGSTQTYLQRYTLMAALGLAASKDDDGHSASKVAASSGETIDADQIATLRRLLKSISMKEERFTAFIKVNSLQDIAAEAFLDACKLLTDKGAKA